MYALLSTVVRKVVAQACTMHYIIVVCYNARGFAGKVDGADGSDVQTVTVVAYWRRGWMVGARINAKS